MTDIRPTRSSDEESLGRFGGALLRQHHASDPQRFILVDRPEEAHDRGRSQVVLWSKSGNEGAQRLFARLGFRATMLEMTLDEPAFPPAPGADSGSGV